MTTWKIGSIYDFVVQDLSLDSRGDYYYRLKNFNNESDETLYRVKVMDYQIDWKFRPSHIRCVVRAVNESGYPLLNQLRIDLLEDVYTKLPGHFTMRVEGKEIDENTKSTYLRLRDSASMQHRFYCTDEEVKAYKSGDEIEVVVTGIRGNDHRAFLVMKSATREQAEASEVSPQAQSAVHVLTMTPTTATKPETPSRPAAKEEEEKTTLYYDGPDEGNKIEWKSSIVYPAGKVQPDMDKQLSVIARTVCGFLNRDGGQLFIGLADNRRIIGIEGEYANLYSEALTRSYQKNQDGYEQALRDALREKRGNYTVSQCVDISFVQLVPQCTLCVVEVKPASIPVFFAGLSVYVRSGNMTTLLRNEEITRFILDRLGLQNSLQVKKMLQAAGQEGHELPKEVQTELVVSYEHMKEDEQNMTNVHATAALLPHLPKSKTCRERYERIECVMVFYKDGSVSYQSDYVEPSPDVIWQHPIPRRTKNARQPYYLMQCYASGCVNKTDVSRLNLKKGSVNGWNTDDQLVNVFLAQDKDKVAIYTKQDDKWYVKMHRVSAISAHTGNLSLQGNLCSKRDNEGCRIYHVDSQNPDLDNLLLRDSYKSTHIGTLLEGRQNYDGQTMKMLTAVCSPLPTPQA